jgi:ABC-type bacteriocin/lantibiotic exporter with double-glycine peptidase domain
MVLEALGKKTDYNTVKELCKTTHDGTSAHNIVKTLRKFKVSVTYSTSTSFELLKKRIAKGYMAIAYLDENHYSVVFGIDNEWVSIADPDPYKPERHAIETFKSRWQTGWALFVKIRD